jgi:hypothetical protein
MFLGNIHRRPVAIMDDRKRLQILDEFVEIFLEV